MLVVAMTAQFTTGAGLDLDFGVNKATLTGKEYARKHTGFGLG